MAELLSQDKDMAASFLNSVLNQLNWAFSEFIGMIQEVRNICHLITDLSKWCLFKTNGKSHPKLQKPEVSTHWKKQRFKRARVNVFF